MLDRERSDHMYVFNQVLATLLVAGGLGVVNYITAEKIGVVDKHSKDKSRQLEISLLCSIIDFAIYLVINELLNKIPMLKGNWLLFWNIIITALLAFLITLFFATPIKKVFYWAINKTRNRNSKAVLDTPTTWEDITENTGDNQQMVYLYDFEHNPLGFGYASYFSNDENDNFSVNVVPFSDKPEVQPTYDSFMLEIQNPDLQNAYNIQQYINFNQKFIMISLIKI